MPERKSKALLRRSYSMYECIVYQYQTKSIVLWCILCFCPETMYDFNRFSSIFSRVQFWISWIIPINKNSLCPLPWIKLLKLQWQMPNMKCTKTALIAPPLPLQLQFPSNKNLAMMKPIRELQSRSQFFLSNSADTFYSDFESRVKLRKYPSPIHTN